MRADLVEVIEACYRTAPSDDAWLGAVMIAVRPVLAHDLGVLGHFFDASDPTRPRAWSSLSLDAPDGAAKVSMEVFQSWPPAIVDRVFRRPKPGITASQLVGRKAWDQIPQRAHWFFPLGFKDSIGVVCTDVTHKGCLLMAPLARVTSVPRRQTVRLRRLAVHVATGLRLRRHLDAGPSREPQAVLHPDGRVVHAESGAKPATAREALRTFAKAVDRARGKMRRSDPDEALKLWEGLAAGRWSLVDHFDTDGRRYVVAHQNGPELAAPNALSLAERQIAGYAAMGHSNKFIAYELGLSDSTVATHLASALMKLGVRSRADLARMFGGIVAPP